MAAAKRSSTGPHRLANRARGAERIGAPMLRAVLTAFRAQLAAALAQLASRTPSDEQIHSARKCIKKARAVLRLLKPTLGDTRYRRENQALRNAARPLSATRDAKVLTDVLEFMAKRRAIDSASAEALRGALARNRKRVDRQMSSLSSVAACRRALRAVDRRASQWSFSGEDGDRVISAFKRIYRRARNAMEMAEEKRTAELLHEWRKEVKYLWHQLQIVQPAQPPDSDEISRSLHKLSDSLGQDHDLAVLRDTVLARRRIFSRRALRTVLAQIDRRRVSLERKAFRLGKTLFAEKPSLFAERFDMQRRARQQR